MKTHPFLLIDAGNTRTKWATASESGKIRVVGERSTRELIPDVIKSLAADFAASSVVLSCVVPRLLPAFRRAFGKRLLIVDGSLPGLPISSVYRRPSEIGADRIAVAMAAHAEQAGPAIIVSCGTATAFTVLDEAGLLCGGAIAPGLAAQLHALVGATAQLPAVTLQAPRRLPATSTEEAIRAGVLLGFQGGVREIVDKLVASLPSLPAPRILLTGGEAHHVRGVLPPRAEVRPLLVFAGLRIIGARLAAGQKS